MSRRRLLRGLLGLALVFAVLQLVPYGRAHDNPPTRVEPRWRDPATRALAVRACFDCHSHETRWPWYAHVAPVSWLLQYDTDAGREALNFSAWDTPQEEADDAAEVVRSGEMPLAIYRLLHPEARLSPAERTALADGLTASLGSDEDDHEASMETAPAQPRPGPTEDVADDADEADDENGPNDDDEPAAR
jgi:hypothetical protein